jgi:hypothetical protein
MNGPGSPGTCTTSHVAHILAKLGLRDRVHVVIFAYETGLAGQDSGLAPVSPAT